MRRMLKSKAGPVEPPPWGERCALEPHIPRHRQGRLRASSETVESGCGGSCSVNNVESSIRVADRGLDDRVESQSIGTDDRMRKSAPWIVIGAVTAGVIVLVAVLAR